MFVVVHLAKMDIMNLYPSSPSSRKKKYESRFQQGIKTYLQCTRIGAMPETGDVITLSRKSMRDHGESGTSLSGQAVYRKCFTSFAAPLDGFWTEGEMNDFGSLPNLIMRQEQVSHSDSSCHSTSMQQP